MSCAGRCVLVLPLALALTLPLTRPCRLLLLRPAIAGATARAGIVVAATLTTAAIAGLAFTHALHHFAARGLGRSHHHLAARRLAGTAPDSLATHGDRLGTLVRLGREALDHLGRNLLAGVAFDLLHEAFFIQAHQTHSRAAVAGPAGAADAVHVVFRHIGNLVIHDVRQFVDVDAAGRDVGRDQRPDVAALEAGQRLGARALALVAVQRQ